MNLARQINKQLDEILEINKVRDDKLKRGFSSSALNLSNGEITKREQEINKITNNGQNIRDIFTNDYYINDVMQDKEITAKIKSENFMNEITGDISN
jgi:hypothetical protein